MENKFDSGNVATIETETMNGTTVRNFRKGKLGLSLERFAMKLTTVDPKGFSSRHLGEVELGKRPVTDRLKKAIKLLKEQL